jgi:hypothetical protein
MIHTKEKHNQLFVTPFAKWFWGISLIIFLIHQILQKVGWIQIPLVDHWLDPLLFPLVVMPLFRWERQYGTGLLGYRLSVFETLGMVLALMLASEVILPWLSPRFIFDPVDLLCIAIGGVLYYIFMQ